MFQSRDQGDVGIKENNLNDYLHGSMQKTREGSDNSNVILPVLLELFGKCFVSHKRM